MRINGIELDGLSIIWNFLSSNLVQPAIYKYLGRLSCSRGGMVYTGHLKRPATACGFESHREHFENLFILRWGLDCRLPIV